MSDRADRDDRMALTAVLKPHMEISLPGLVDTVNKLVRHSRTLQRLHEMACNDPEYGEKEEKKCQRIMAKVKELLPDSIKAQENGDPRGWSLILVLPDGKSNDWGGRGWGVPN